MRMLNEMKLALTLLSSEVGKYDLYEIVRSIYVVVFLTRSML